MHGPSEVLFRVGRKQQILMCDFCSSHHHIIIYPGFILEYGSNFNLDTVNDSYSSSTFNYYSSSIVL